MRSTLFLTGLSSVAAIVALIACGAPYGAAADVPSGDDAATGPGSDGPSSADGTGSGDGAPAPECAPPACALLAPPSGWELVLLGTSRTDACPAGFDAADPIESPAASKDACRCAACLTTGTSCSTGSVPTSLDQGGGACGSPGSSLDVNGGACKNLSGTFGQDARIGAPTAVLGTCTSAGAGDPTSVVVQARRLCTRQASGCNGGACGAPSSMQACIATPGDVTCPPAAPTKHLLGADFTLACASCACTISAATCGGSVDFFPQAGCAGAPISLNIGGVCTATAAAPFMSTKFIPLVATTTCSTVPGAPTTTLTAMQTVCCP